MVQFEALGTPLTDILFVMLFLYYIFSLMDTMRYSQDVIKYVIVLREGFSTNIVDLKVLKGGKNILNLGDLC